MVVGCGVGDGDVGKGLETVQHTRIVVVEYGVGDGDIKIGL